MDLVNKASCSNDFGLRKRFPWTGIQNHAPWLEDTTVSETSYIMSMHGLTGSVKRIQNPYLWARYMLQYEELKAESKNVSERIVIHATSNANALKIADDNFNWRFVCRYKFGRGVSFAKHAAYAKRHAQHKNVYIIAGILVSEISDGNCNTIIPPGGCDTTVDCTYGNVYVKYYDNEFYPYYIVQ